MLNRMTIWAQHFKIAKIVVFAIAIFVVHAKNFWVRVVSAPHACRKYVSFEHVFTYGRKFWAPLFFSRFIDARFRTILSFVRRRGQKFNAAMHASVLYSTFSAHRLVVTLRRAILCFVGAAGDVTKYCFALKARSSYLHSSSKCETLSAAIERSVFSVRRYRECSATLLANLFVTNTGAGHAFGQVSLQRSV